MISTLFSPIVRAVALVTLLLAAVSGYAAPPQQTGSLKTIRVVMDDNYPPYVFKGDQGELKGIIVDQWRLWEKQTGIAVVLTGTDWSEAQRRMQGGEFDVIDTIFHNEKREEIYEFTKPYAQLDVPLFFHEDILVIRGPEDLKGFLVAVKAGDSAIDVLKKHGVTNIAEYPSYEKLIEAARDGKAKVFTVDRPPALYFLNKMGIQNRFRETKPLYHGEFHRAVLKGQSALLSVVESGFASISKKDYEAVDQRWMGERIRSLPYFRYALYGAGFIAILLLLLAIWLIALRRAVAEKTGELAKSEELFRLIMKYSPVYVFVKEVTPTGIRVLQASDNFVEMVGIAGSKMIGKSMEELFPPEFAAKISADDQAVVAGGEVLKFEEELNSRTYTTIKFSLTQGDKALLAGFAIDITERKLAEKELLYSKSLADAALDSSPDGILIVDLDRKIARWNRKFVEFLRIPESLLKAPFDDTPVLQHVTAQVADPGAFLAKVQALYEHPEESSEDTLYLADGRVFDRYSQPLKVGNEVLGRFWSFRDITERKRAEDERLNLEKQLLHAQKLESLGVLAGGIAHDFNNILMAIIGNADLALMRINKESPATENLHKIELAAARAADLAKQMLAYSGKGKFVVENIDINCMLEEMLHMLQVSITKKAVLRFNLHTQLPPVEADATQMHQIIMNLVINASEAIEATSGVIAITTGCMECDRNYLKDVWLDENLADGLYVFLEIADSGCGMDKETMARLFDPFFTTKFTGRGLGMAAVLGIVRGHKGAIKVYSELNKGTTFKILLPSSNRPAEQPVYISQAADWQGSGTVLVVDDEETVRGVGVEMLTELGFTAITANDGHEALELFKITPEITFVILDLTMPHMDGEQCFRELKQLQPDVKVIISSGYNEQEVTQKFVGKGLAGFIQKPYRLSVLKEVVRGIQ